EKLDGIQPLTDDGTVECFDVDDDVRKFRHLVLWCHSARVLRCYGATVLRCYGATVPRCYGTQMLLPSKPEHLAPEHVAPWHLAPRPLAPGPLPPCTLAPRPPAPATTRLLFEPVDDLLARPVMIVVQMQDDRVQREPFVAPDRTAAPHVLEAVEQAIQTRT